MPLEDDESIRQVLLETKKLAVLGIKAGLHEDAFRVPAYMQQHGLRLLPVSPKLDEVLGETCVPNLQALPETPDMINVFRAVPHLPGHTDEILALPSPPKSVWFQLGIRDDASAERLEQGGIAVVQNRCLMVEWARLAGGETPSH